MTIPEKALRSAQEATEGGFGITDDYMRRALTAALPFLQGVSSPRAQALEEAAQALEAWGDIYGDNAAKCVRALSSQPVADGCKGVDELAAYLCDEFDFDLNPVRGASWPEHENDEGKREGGYVRLQPSDVRAYARENAKRILAFLSLPASQGASE